MRFGSACVLGDLVPRMCWSVRAREREREKERERERNKKNRRTQGETEVSRAREKTLHEVVGAAAAEEAALAASSVGQLLVLSEAVATSLPRA